jgi:hypothetical protein
MVRTQPAPVTESRQKVAAQNMSRVQKLNRALQSGRLKMDLRTVSEAIHAARGIHSQIKDEGIEAKDYHVKIAFLTPDLSMLSTHSYVPGEDAEIQAALSGQCCIMVGTCFAIRDWEKKNWVVGYRPFLSTQLVDRAFANWMDSVAILNEGN